MQINTGNSVAKYNFALVSMSTIFEIYILPFVFQNFLLVLSLTIIYPSRMLISGVAGGGESGDKQPMAQVLGRTNTCSSISECILNRNLKKLCIKDVRTKLQKKIIPFLYSKCPYYIKVPRPRDSKVTFSVFESSFHLLLTV